MKKSVYTEPTISITAFDNKSDVIMLSNAGITQTDDSITEKYAANTLGFSKYSGS